MSIRLRLTIYWALVLGAILLIAAIAAFKLFEREQYGAISAALLEEADTSARELSFADRPRAEALLRGLSLERDLGPRRRVVVMTGGKLIEDFGSQKIELPNIPLSNQIRGIQWTKQREFAFAIKPLTFLGEDATLMDGADLTPVVQSIDRLRDALMIVIPILLILCVAGGYLLAGRALAPVASLGASLAAIQPHDLHRRLPAPEAYDEIGRLTDVINALLDRLESASAVERRFASDAAHELRTPLAVLRTGLDVALARERSSEENRAALESAHREVVSLCKIAEELLMLTRLNGEVAIERKPVDLRALVAEVTTTVESLAAAKNIDLRTVELTSAIIEGSAAHLRRLVINLIDNALKFTPPGGKIEVGLSSAGGRAILRVADTGPGVAPQELPLIFERFFRGAHAGGEGSGLGLSLCREIARYHGGQIAAANRPGGGTVFVVKLPLRGTRALQPAESAQLTDAERIA
jgi:signal transduction histidine kinase